MNFPASPVRACCASLLALALAACGQTGPLFLPKVPKPTPGQAGTQAPPAAAATATPAAPATAAPLPGNVSGEPPSGVVPSRDDSQMQQPNPNLNVPRPGTY